jgi:hypothetical protein
MATLTAVSAALMTKHYRLESSYSLSGPVQGRKVSTEPQSDLP